MHTRATEGVPALDAEVLLAHALNRPRSHLYAWPEQAPDADAQARFDHLMRRRAQGEPLAHLTGRREFWSLTLEVSAASLVPRPETEGVVSLALALVHKPRARIADLGTGSGAIALALAGERPGWQLIATDQSRAALHIAQANALRLGSGNVHFAQGDWCKSLDLPCFDAIVANPPYVCSDDALLTTAPLCFEPRAALDGGADGLDALRCIIADAPDHLCPGGWLVLEHGRDQGRAVRALLAAHAYREVQTHPDLAGHARVSCGMRPML